VDSRYEDARCAVVGGRSRMAFHSLLGLTIGHAVAETLAPFLNFGLGKRPVVYDYPCMPQPHIDVSYVANLARLELSAEETATFQVQLDAILGYVETLSRLDVSGIEATAHAVPVCGRMRADEPRPSLPPQAVLQNAPDQSQGQIRVPKVVADA
jgi:aspartyl-tRNA(Asn)/glutamyl-tRNA(Gln) amidotransferase subunit C